MKNILLDIIDNDLSYNKSATRYLYKTHPNLWTDIINATAFLPVTAKPKQRIWHIVNNIYEIPLCPVTNQPVKWHENRYLEALNPRASMLLQHKRGDFAHGHSPEINAKRSKTNKATANRGRKYRDLKTYTTADRKKFKQTCLEKYGVDNPSKNKEVQEKIDDLTSEIKGYESLIKMHASSTPKDIVEEGYDAVPWIAGRIDEILEELKAAQIQVYQLELYLEYLNDQHVKKTIKPIKWYIKLKQLLSSSIILRH